MDEQLLVSIEIKSFGRKKRCRVKVEWKRKSRQQWKEKRRKINNNSGSKQMRRISNAIFTRLVISSGRSSAKCEAQHLEKVRCTPLIHLMIGHFLQFIHIVNSYSIWRQANIISARYVSYYTWTERWPHILSTHMPDFSVLEAYFYLIWQPVFTDIHHNFLLLFFFWMKNAGQSARRNRFVTFFICKHAILLRTHHQL